MSMTIQTFSLLNVAAAREDGTVDGYWIQDHVGSHQGALKKAAATSAANSGIQVAVVERIEHPTPMLEYWTACRVVQEA